MVFGDDGGRVHVTASVFKTGISVEGNEQPLLLGLGSELNAGKRHAKAWKEEKANRSWWLTHPTLPAKAALLSLAWPTHHVQDLGAV